MEEDDSRKADRAPQPPAPNPPKAAAPPGALPADVLPADPVAANPKPAVTEPDPAPLPAEPDRASDDLRTGEVVARIWIAPFVDADGVYREASHVRVVLEPAGWRLGR